MAEKTAEYVVARNGRTYQVLVPESVVTAGSQAVEAYLENHIKAADTAREAEEAADRDARKQLVLDAAAKASEEAES